VYILKSAIKITSVIQYVFEGETLAKMYTANTVLNSFQENSSGYSPSSVRNDGSTWISKGNDGKYDMTTECKPSPCTR
jgi:hypothetical protein